MLTKNVQTALNDQLNLELSASYNYLAKSAYCETQKFSGFAQWLRLQSQEEYGHAMKLYEFLIARDGLVRLKQIEAPKGEFQSVQTVFKDSLKEEIETSRRIDELYELASQEKNFAALVELQWFIAEQVEEEHTFRTIVTKIEMIQDDPSGLLDMDRELAGRANK